MADLLWPGSHRADAVFDDDHVARAMLRVERAWLTVLAETGVAPPAVVDAPARTPRAADPQPWTLSADDIAALTTASEASGNPVVPLVALLRERWPEPAATWLHRGLTSQDVLDSALMLCAADAVARIQVHLADQIAAVAALADRHRNTPMLARTLTQPATPTSFGIRAAAWLTGLLDADDVLAAARLFLRIQVGGSSGTLAAVAELAHGRGAADPASTAMRAADALAATLHLQPAAPWHTARGPITALGDAMVGCTDAWGHIARDLLQGARVDNGEVKEDPAAGRGGSSTLPGKHNPVLSVLLHRAALAGPGLAATLHAAAADAVDDRPDGSWHAEWDTLATLARRTVVAADQATELLSTLQVDTAAMAANLLAAAGIDAEQRSMATLTEGRPAAGYRGATDLIIDRILDRARQPRYQHHPGVRPASRTRAAEQ